MAFLGFFKKNNKKEDKITNKSSDNFNIRNLDETSRPKNMDKFPLDIPEPPVLSSKNIKKPSLNIDLPESGKIPKKTETPESMDSLKKSLSEEKPEKEMSFKGHFESAFEDNDIEKPLAEDFPLPELDKKTAEEKEPDEEFKPEGYDEPEPITEEVSEIPGKKEIHEEEPPSPENKKSALETYFKKRDSFEDKLDLFVDINNYSNALDGLDYIVNFFKKEGRPSNKLNKIEKRQISFINNFIDITEDVQSQLMLIDEKIFEK